MWSTRACRGGSHSALASHPPRFCTFCKHSRLLQVRGSPVARDAVWRALSGLLPRSPLLCQQPWNHVLVTFSLKQAPLDQLSTDFLAFVLEWLRQVAPAEQPEPTPR